MTGSYIAIRSRQPEIIEKMFLIFDYIDTHNDKPFHNWQSFNEYLYDHFFEYAHNGISLCGIWVQDDWTIISDPEMVDTLNTEALSQLSKKLNTDIITLTIQTSSNSYGFSVYKTSIQRHFFVSDGEIMENISDPLPEEQGVNICADIFADDILKLAGNFGIDIEGKKNTTYTIKQLISSGAEKTELQKAKPEKPWWKFW